MAEKCASCNGPVDIVFLDKISGTYLRVKGKKRAVCSACQKNYAVETLRTRL